MKKNRTLKVFALVLALILCLCACGGGGGKSDSGTGTDKGGADTTFVSEAQVDPAEMEWGYNRDMEGNNDPQYWYGNGDKTQDQFIFFYDDTVTKVDGENREEIDTKIMDKHIVDYDTEGTVFDFVFTDVFTCYDLVSGQCYKRADYDTVLASLTASTFVCEAGDKWKFTFSQDGTMEYDNDGELLTGTWWFEDAYTVEFQFDEEDYTTWINIHYADDGWEIVSLEDTDLFYPEN